MIIEYNKIYEEDVKDLLEQLQNHVAAMDEEKFNIKGENFREEYFQETLDEVKRYHGKIFLYKENGMILGLVVGIINNEEIESCNFKAPKRGRITELIVNRNYRNKGIGDRLLEYIEDYLKSNGCEHNLMGLFSYDDKGLEFYKKHGYKERMTELIKMDL